MVAIPSNADIRMGEIMGGVGMGVCGSVDVGSCGSFN